MTIKEFGQEMVVAQILAIYEELLSANAKAGL